MARILLIEPDKHLAKNTAAFLLRAGHEVECHSDLQRAVAAADKRMPDVIITEMLLASRSGVELIYEIRSYPDWQSLPIIAYSMMQPSHISQLSAALENQDITLLSKMNVSLSRLLQEVAQVLRPLPV